MAKKDSLINVSTPIQSDNRVIIPNIKLVVEFLQFVNWKATPEQCREIKTQKKFAQSIGVAEDTLTDWKRHPQFWSLVSQNINGWMRDRVPDVIEGLYRRAVGEGKAKDVESFLKLSGIEFDNSKNKF